MFTERINFSLAKYLLPVFVMVVLFAFYYRLNDFKPVKHVTIDSSVDFNRKAFEVKISQIPDINRGRQVRIIQEALDIRLSLPEHWNQTLLKVDSIARTRFSSADLKTCVDLLVREDKMPLLEAAMDSPLMWLEPGIPYLGKLLAETSIDSHPAFVGHIRLRGLGSEKPNDVFVPNALIVVGNRFSVVLRSCGGSTDEAFYQIYKSLKIRMN